MGKLRALIEIMIWLMVALGGSLGALGRYGSLRVMQAMVPEAFLWNTLLVNFLGSFFAGFLFLFLQTRSQPLTAFLMIGVLGSFTTFSSFSLESIHLLREHNYFLAGSNIVLNLSLCLVATALGFYIASSYVYASRA